MTIWRVIFTLDDAIPAQATLLSTIKGNVTQLTDPTNQQALFTIQKAQ